MYALNEKLQSTCEQQQQRSVSGRMITDIEMNGTIRGAVEEFNLCTILRINDVLFAECIRTFPTVHVNAQQWLYCLEVEQGNCASMKVTTSVPATRTPHAKSLNSRAPWVDLYGFSPLEPPFVDLCPFEFLQHFNGVALTYPVKSDESACTRWTTCGSNMHKIAQFRKGNVKAVAGKHYEVVEPSASDNYWCFLKNQLRSTKLCVTPGF